MCRVKTHFCLENGIGHYTEGEMEKFHTFDHKTFTCVTSSSPSFLKFSGFAVRKSRRGKVLMFYLLFYEWKCNFNGIKIDSWMNILKPCVIHIHILCTCVGVFNRSIMLLHTLARQTLNVRKWALQIIFTVENIL